MFKTEKGFNSNLNVAVANAEKNYVLRKNDMVQLRVYTGKGELLLDPDRQLARTIGGNQNNVQNAPAGFIINENGIANLPMVGKVELAGLTKFEADSVLKIRYEKFYNDTYVLLQPLNRRAIVLGGTGGRVIPLDYENMTVIEVIASFGGIDQNAKAQNIRLIRGDLKNPEVEVIDLSTITGMQKANLRVLPGDIIYIEPVRRVVQETVRDISPILSLFTSVITFVVLITSINSPN